MPVCVFACLFVCLFSTETCILCVDLKDEAPRMPTSSATKCPNDNVRMCHADKPLQDSARGSLQTCTEKVSQPCCGRYVDHQKTRFVS